MLGPVMTGDFERVAEEIRAGLGYMRATAKRDREMIARSFDLLFKAEQLLRMPVPKVWHPVPPRSVAAALVNAQRSATPPFSRLDCRNRISRISAGEVK